MSMLAKIAKNVVKAQAFKNTTAAQTPSFQAPGNQDKILKWISTLSNKATTGESRSYCTQLSSLVSFYNKQHVEQIPTIDFNEWKNVISTQGLVEKVKENYESLIKEQYNTDAISKQISSASSKALDDIENELSFHAAIWLNAYADYTMFLFELEEYNDPNDYLMHENFDFFRGLETELEELTETHNYIPGSKDDVNLRGYLATQFAWGKKVISFYRHPADDFKCAKATKNMLGR
ncbi:hypothetical protein ABPG74_019280 [Tetrahymena malaccensis]